MTAKVWHKLPAPPAGFAGTLGIPPFHAHLLYNRGIRSPSDVESFLSADSRLRHDPMLFADMDKAVARLTSALRSSESIGVFGDFDTDGITGTALLARALRDLGASVFPYIPDRVQEGHGLNPAAIRLLRGDGVSVLVTVDCGATAVDEVEMARTIGMDTIITDHHSLLGALPDACALINPRREDSAYPYADLTGVGMAFKLVEALYADLGKPWPEHLLELVALGTVADVAPLTGENRFFVKRGLEHLNVSQSPGVQALAATAGLELGSLDTESLSFGLIPRLNVAGRLGHARTSLSLLMATSLETAEPLAQELEVKNTERKSLTEAYEKEARCQVEAKISSEGTQSVLFARDPNWPPGLLGLIASRLVDRYNRPAIAVAVGEELSRASARSIPEFDIGAALRDNGDILVRFGGHPRAAGFTIATPSLPVLEEQLIALADHVLRDADLTPRIDIDCEVSPQLLAGTEFSFIKSMAPFGEGNPAPVFFTRNARVLEARRVGRDSQHLKMRVWHSGSAWDVIAFNQGSGIDRARGAVDLVYTAGVDSWSGTPRFQLNVVDFKTSRP